MTELQEIKTLLQSMNDRFSVVPRWLSMKQACAYASMSENKLMEHINADDIYATKKGGKRFVDRESIDAFMLSDSRAAEKRFAEITRRVV